MYTAKYYRIPLGDYPKWVGRIIQWGLSKRLPKGSYILLRGRGARKKNGQYIGRATRYSLPLCQATRVGIYVIVKNAHYEMLQQYQLVRKTA